MRGRRDDVEYSVKLAVIRILSLIFILGLFFMLFEFFTAASDTEKIDLETFDLIEEKENTFNRNSRGNIYSLDENVFVEGTAKIEGDELILSSFKITNNKNMVLEFSSGSKPSSLLHIAKMQSNVGTLSFDLPTYNTGVHDTIIFRDNKENKVLAYMKVEELFP